MQVVQHWIISEHTILLPLAMASQRPRPGSWALVISEFGVQSWSQSWSRSLPVMFTGDGMADQWDNCRGNYGGNHGDDCRVDQRLDQRLNWKVEMINEMTMEMTLESILELTGDWAEISDPDSCPLTQGAKGTGKQVYASETHSHISSLLSIYTHWGGEHHCHCTIYLFIYFIVH